MAHPTDIIACVTSGDKTSRIEITAFDALTFTPTYMLGVRNNMIGKTVQAIVDNYTTVTVGVRKAVKVHTSKVAREQGGVNVVATYECPAFKEKINEWCGSSKSTHNRQDQRKHIRKDKRNYLGKHGGLSVSVLRPRALHSTSHPQGYALQR